MIIIEIVNLLIEAAILIVLIDAEYGITRLTKLSKRRWKRFYKQFMRASKKYFSRKVKQGEAILHESNGG